MADCEAIEADGCSAGIVNGEFASVVLHGHLNVVPGMEKGCEAMNIAPSTSWPPFPLTRNWRRQTHGIKNTLPITTITP